MNAASPLVPTSDKKSDTPSAPLRPRRKSGKSGKATQPVVRPLVPPPAPPINHKTHPQSSSSSSANASSTPGLAQNSLLTTSDKIQAVQAEPSDIVYDNRKSVDVEET